MSDLELIARTVWGEARTAPVHGQEAIASVILNRRAAAEFGRSPAWGRSIRAVCLAPRQFACWTPGHPNRNLILTVGREDPVFIICRRIARRALAGTLDDRTAGATHYHPSTVFPSWATGQVASAEIGGYLFYNTIVNP